MASSLLLALTLAAGAPSATLQEFEDVLAQNSATVALEQWCGARRIADPAVITAHKLTTGTRPPPSHLRMLLGVNGQQSVDVRNVKLACGRTVLSVAWNWYVPALLSPDMRAALADGDVPFGKIVAPLHFRRESLPAYQGRGEMCPSGTISTHRARLLLPNGTPLAYVVECYTAANLATTAR